MEPQLLEYGVLGIVIVGLIYIVKDLRAENKLLYAQLNALSDAYSEKYGALVERVLMALSQEDIVRRVTDVIRERDDGNQSKEDT